MVTFLALLGEVGGRFLRLLSSGVLSFCLQKHHRFYSSLFALVRQPRSLQHLCRCALRSHLEGCLPHALPRLPLPPRMLRYLQLDFEDLLY